MAAIWGLDIGRSALKGVKVRAAPEGLEISEIVHIPYPVEDDEDEKSGHIAEALQQFLAKHKLASGDQVVVGLAGLNAFSRFIKLPPVERSKVASLVHLEAQQQIPFPIAEVNWDFVQLPQVEEGDEIEVGIFATRREVVDGFLTELKAAGIRPDVITVVPLSIYNFIRYNNEFEDGATVVLDIGAEHTDLVIADGERFWIRNLRIAGNDVTRALAERFKVPFSEAEKLKRSASKSAQAAKIFSSMEPVLKDLANEIQRSVAFFKNQAEGLDVKRVVLLGDGSKLKNLPKFLREQLKYKVARVAQLEEGKFVIEGEVDLDVLRNHILGFGVALGLAVQGAGLSACSINLAPQQVQIQSHLRSKVPWAAAAAVISWLTFLMGYGYYGSLAATYAAEAKEIPNVSQYDSIQTQALEVKNVDDLLAQAQTYTSLGAGRGLILELLNTMSEVLPQNNGKLPEWNHSGHKSEPLDQQIQAFEELVSREQINEKKLWLLEWRAERRNDPENPNRLEVEVWVARMVPRSMRQQLDRVREDIRNDFVKPLTSRLTAAPFYLRRLTDQGPKYGELEFGTLKEIYALHTDAKDDPGSRNVFHCIVVPVRFEIGVPPPPEPPPAPPAGEGEGEQGDQGGE